MTSSRETQQRAAAAVGLPSVRRHIFLCCDQTTPKCCDKERSLEAWSYLKSRLKELGLSEAGGCARTKANCLRVCEGGPIAVVYPEGSWYAGCDPPVLEQIIQRHLMRGEVAEEYAIGVYPLAASEGAEEATEHSSRVEEKAAHPARAERARPEWAGRPRESAASEGAEEATEHSKGQPT